MISEANPTRTLKIIVVWTEKLFTEYIEEIIFGKTERTDRRQKTH